MTTWRARINYRAYKILEAGDINAVSLLYTVIIVVVTLLLAAVYHEPKARVIMGGFLITMSVLGAICYCVRCVLIRMAHTHEATRKLAHAAGCGHDHISAQERQ